MVLASVVFGFLIFETTLNFFESKVVLELSRKEIPIEDIPFPAVTICPQLFNIDDLQGFSTGNFTVSDDK